MKKWICMCALCFLLCLPACSFANSATQPPEQGEVQTADTDKEQSTTLDEAGSPSYYGEWQIVSCICTAPVSALSNEEIEQILQTSLVYAEDSYIWNGNTLSSPEYTQSVQTAEDFASSYRERLTFADLGLDGDEIAAISIDNSDLLGNFFYVKDVDSLIICYEGVFFEALRK